MNDELQVWNYNTHEIRTITREGEPWFVAKDICVILGLKAKSTSPAVAKLSDNMKDLATVQTAGGPQKLLVISKTGLDVIVSKSVKCGAIEFCHAIHIETIMTRQEASSLLTITKAFVQLQMMIQYRVGPYRIDLYIPKYKLAVECDEHDHSAYPGQDEAARQTFIESALGCTFIRFNPDAQEFNIGTVINRMLMQMRMQDTLQGATL
jgi:very-short-patch-repair endonuclease